MSLGKVIALILGLLMLGALAASAGAQFYGNSWPYSGAHSPFGLVGPGGLNSMFSPFGSSFGYPGYGSYGYGPFSSYYGYPSGSYYGYPSGSLFNNDLFSGLGSDSPFGSMFGGNLFKAKQYGPPPEDNITRALVGQRLTYEGGYMSLPLQYEIEEGDIGDIAGTQYQGADAWKVRVGQAGRYWDVIVDGTGNEILGVTQVR